LSARRQDRLKDAEKSIRGEHDHNVIRAGNIGYYGYYTQIPLFSPECLLLQSIPTGHRSPPHGATLFWLGGMATQEWQWSKPVWD